MANLLAIDEFYIGKPSYVELPRIAFYCLDLNVGRCAVCVGHDVEARNISGERSRDHA